MKIQLSKVKLDRLDKKSVISALQLDRLGRGKYGELFEKEFSRWLGVNYSIAVSHGSAALHIAVLLENIRKGDEVLTTPFSYIASSNVITYAGGVPKFVDINKDTLCLDENLIKKSITKKTKAILAVHIFGFPANIIKINSIAQEYGLAVIEDACQAHGAELFNKKVGTFNNTTAFSFYSNKIVTCGEGGITVVNTLKKLSKAILLRDHGRRKPHGELVHDIIGYNYGLDEISSALGLSQIRKIDEILISRENLANHYYARLKDIDGIELPYLNKDYKRSWFVFYIKLPNKKIRHILQKKLQIEKIATKLYYPSIHLQPCYREKFGYKRGMLPISEEASDTILALPLYNDMRFKDINIISDTIKYFVSKI